MPEQPVANTKPHSFTHHGKTIQDPYAWLRDPGYPEVTDKAVLDYLAQENNYFDEFYAPLQPLVEEIFTELKGRVPAQDESVPYEKNGFLYQWRFAPEAQYRSWFRAPIDDRANWQVLLDETSLAEGHEYFSLGALSVSPDNSKLIYSTDTEGGERYTMHAVDLATGTPLCETIEGTLGSAIWDAKSSSFLYTVLNDQWQPLQAFHKTLNTMVEDKLIFEEADPSFRVGLSLSQSEQMVFIETSSHTQSEVYVVPRDELGQNPRLIAPRAPDFEYDVDHRPGQYVILSNLRQQNFDLYVAPDDAPEDAPGTANWQLLVEGNEHEYLTGYLALADYIAVEHRIDGLDQIRILHTPEGALPTEQHLVAFPEPVYSTGLHINAQFEAHSIRLSYTSMVTPNSLLEYDLRSRQLSTLKEQTIPSGYDASQFTSDRLMATARDGAQVPVSLVHHKDTPTDGSAPVYLYAYGAYGYGIDPSFSSVRISLLERGFIFAIAHIRGGDELGYHWYTEGKLEKRTNTFNDFVDVAQFMIDKNLARAGNFAIAGGSAGGELMGAVVNQAPEMWGAVAAHVPFVDVLNTMLDASLPLTPPEWNEWGNPIEDESAFGLILSYSPYDQLAPGEYPPMLVTAGLNDPRVTYWEPAKYVAKLRTLKQDDNPLLLKTNMGAGHGGQSGRFSALREVAEEYAFFVTQLAKSDK